MKLMNKVYVTFFLFFSYIASSQNYNVSKLDSLCRILDSNHKLLGSIYISKADRKIFEYNFNKDNKFRGITRIASITKIYTVVMIMQLIEEGKLNLNDKLSKFYPRIDGSAKITIENMLAHQSGIYSFDNDYLLGDLQSWIYRSQSKEAMLERFYSYKIQFEPGSKTQYSNTAYALLGYIVEDLSNASFNQQLQDRICTKLGLTQTYCADIVDTNYNESYSYIKDNDWIQYPSSDLSGAAVDGAGGICTSPLDLSNFYHAIFNGSLVSAHSLELMTMNKMGFNKDNLTESQYSYGHLGSIDAYYNSATYNPIDSVCFVFLFNGLAYPFSDVFFKTIDIFYDNPVKLPSFIASDIGLDKLKLCEGKFKMRNGSIIEINISNNKLFFDWNVPGYGKFELMSIADNVFLYEPKGLTFKFGYNKQKLIDKLTMYQGKQVIIMEKI